MKILKNKINNFMITCAVGLTLVTCAPESREGPQAQPGLSAPLNTPKDSNLPPIKILSIDGGGINAGINALPAPFELALGELSAGDELASFLIHLGV